MNFGYPLFPITFPTGLPKRIKPSSGTAASSERTYAASQSIISNTVLVTTVSGDRLSRFFGGSHPFFFYFVFSLTAHSLFIFSPPPLLLSHCLTPQLPSTCSLILPHFSNHPLRFPLPPLPSCLSPQIYPILILPLRPPDFAIRLPSGPLSPPYPSLCTHIR